MFTVPANRVAIVKDLRAWLSAATAPPITITFVVAKADTTTRTILRATAAAAGQEFAFHAFGDQLVGGPWIVLQEGDALRLTQPASCTVQSYCSGTLLDGDPA